MARYDAVAEAARIADERMGLFRSALREKAEKREADQRAAERAGQARSDDLSGQQARERPEADGRE